MTLRHIRGFKDELKKFIQKTIESELMLSDIFIVTGVNDDLTCNIKKLNLNIQYDNVEVLGLGKGHLKGQILLPEVGDLVFVEYINNSVPIILGGLSNNYVSSKDVSPSVYPQEYFVTNKANGGFIFIQEDNSIKIISSGSKLKLNTDGSFKLFNKDNYGIECDSDGNVTIRDSSGSVTTTDTQGTW